MTMMMLIFTMIGMATVIVITSIIMIMKNDSHRNRNAQQKVNIINDENNYYL